MDDAETLRAIAQELQNLASQAYGKPVAVRVTADHLRRWASRLEQIADGHAQSPLREDFADRYHAARKQLTDQLAAEIVSRNSMDDRMETLHRTEGEADTEFVRRIVATYLALTSTGTEPHAQRPWPMFVDIAQIIDAGWKSGKSSHDVAIEIFQEFDAAPVTSTDRCGDDK